MKTTTATWSCALALVIGGLIVAGPPRAGKADGAGKGKNGKHERTEQGTREDRSGERRHHFDDKHRVVLRQYYQEEFRGGRCPPGLAKKNNGCLPPGQAKKWQYGRPLPRDVVHYE